MKKLIFAVILATLPALALAQPVQQSGTIAPGHSLQWVAPGVVKDSGPASNGTLSGLGTQSSGLGYCQNSGPITGTYTSLCSGFIGGTPTIAVGGNSGASALNFNINGTTYTLPGSATNISSSTASTGLANSVLRTLSSWFSDRAEALEYGCAAVINTSADAAPCISNTLAAAASSNRVAHFPGGVYQILSQVTIPAVGVTLEGDGTDPNGPSSGHGTWFNIGYTLSAPFNLIQGNNWAFYHIGWTQTQPVPALSWSPTVYPPVILAGSNSFALNGLDIQDNFLFGIYDFLRLVYGQRLNVNKLWGEPFHSAIDIWASPDVAHIDNEHYWPFWLFSYNPSQSIANAVVGWQQTNGTPFISRRNDDPNLGDYFAFGYNKCLYFSHQDTGPATGVTSLFRFTNVGCDATMYGLYNDGPGTTGKIVNFDADGADYTTGSTAAPQANSIGIYDAGGGITLQMENVTIFREADSAIEAAVANSGSVITIGNSTVQAWSIGSGSFSPAFYATAGNSIKVLDEPVLSGTINTFNTTGELQSANVVMPVVHYTGATNASNETVALSINGSLTGGVSTRNSWNSLSIPFSTVCLATADVFGRDVTTADYAQYKLYGQYSRGASGNATFIATSSTNIAESSGASSWAVAFVTDTTNNTAAINATAGSDANTVHWTANVTENCQ